MKASKLLVLLLFVFLFVFVQCENDAEPDSDPGDPSLGVDPASLELSGSPMHG